jgi:UDP-glucose 4-epimerase
MNFKKLDNQKILLIGGAGFIGSYILYELLQYNCKEIIIYDDFSKGTFTNIEEALKDPRVKIYDKGGNILHIDILNDAMQNVDIVFHLAALWLFHCDSFPRSAFHVNIEGTFNVLEACRNNNIKKLIYSSSASVYGNAIEKPMTENHPLNSKNYYNI